MLYTGAIGKYQSMCHRPPMQLIQTSLLCLSIPFFNVSLKPGMNILDGMVDATSLS